MKTLIKIILIILLLVQVIGINAQPLPSDSTQTVKKLKIEKRKAARKKIINTIGVFIIASASAPIFIAVVSAFEIKR